MTGNSVIGERTLWQTVLILGVKEALEGQRKDFDKTIDHRRADAWIRDGRQDFRLVCALAGFDPEFVRDHYISGRISLERLIASDTTNRQYRAAELVTIGKIGGDRRSSNVRV